MNDEGLVVEGKPPTAAQVFAALLWLHPIGPLALGMGTGAVLMLVFLAYDTWRAWT